MAEVLLFHHAHGLTEGVRVFAAELREHGHTVHTPDLYDGQTFESLDDGIAFAQQVGFGEILERGVGAADELPDELVYAGYSIGVMPAQKLAQTRAGARGALFFHASVPPGAFAIRHYRCGSRADRRRRGTTRTATQGTTARRP